MAEEDGCDWGGTVGVSYVYPNRDILKDCQARAPGAPWFRHLCNFVTFLAIQLSLEWRQAYV